MSDGNEIRLKTFNQISELIKEYHMIDELVNDYIVSGDINKLENDKICLNGIICKSNTVLQYFFDLGSKTDSFTVFYENSNFQGLVNSIKVQNKEEINKNYESFHSALYKFFDKCTL